jgi:ADP-heptose:LPS heptosyltransferase
MAIALKKILIIRFSSIGDIVLTTPVVRCLKQQYPDSEIHYLTKKVFQPVLKANPYIHKIHMLEGDMNQLLSDLHSEGFDFVVDLHRNLRSRIVKLRLRKPSGTFSKLNREKWLLVNARINMLPDIHIVHRYFKAVEKLDVTYDNNGLDYFIPNDEKPDLKSVLPVEFHEKYLLAVVGGKHKTKQIPPSKMVEILNKASMPVVLAGGKEDIEQANQLMEKLSVPTFNSCGKFSINESAWLVKKAQAVLSPDTGLMHIAAAFRKPLISMWGNTVPEFGMYPFLPSHEQNKYRIHEVKGLNCRPCSKIGFERCPKGHFRCMNDIPAEEVISSIKSLASNL